MIAMVRRTALVIAGDTGPLHLAAALGRPVVGLFGPTDPARTGPYGTGSYRTGSIGTRTRVLRHESSRDDHRKLVAAEAGLGLIEVDAVTAAAVELLQNGMDEIQRDEG
jgi:heptosyltransferase-1